ncbi:hypothetical protein TRVL_09087 [Trypanosoma vivax]|uniref:Uncharacterized protein n=1 Tax=Trypanosoma vivax (strain Y486) TaxID=1055687 RepID=G0U9D7_TRYVY|nr:hypothetical protein TRVL_09087 [Trypanosoma vivax]CCC54222.1 conserved hypothetical protein [Trypanosoma vivax Y486]
MDNKSLVATPTSRPFLTSLKNSNNSKGDIESKGSPLVTAQKVLATEVGIKDGGSYHNDMPESLGVVDCGGSSLVIANGKKKEEKSLRRDTSIPSYYTTGSTTSNKMTLERRLEMAEANVATQKKELLLLRRQIHCKGSQHNDHRLENALKEIASLRSMLDAANKKSDCSHDDAISRMQATIDKLTTEKNDLIDCVRKQNKLIDVLKRQKIHLEAAVLLDFSDKELGKYFELAR